MEPYNKSASYTQSCQTQHFINGSLQTTNRLNVNLSEVLNGFKYPPWRSRVRDHRNATTPCSGTRSSLDKGYMEVESERKDYNIQNVLLTTTRYSAYGNLWNEVGALSIPSVPGFAPPSLDNVALTRFYQSANSQLNQASGMVALGELRETVRQLKHPFKSLTDLLKTRERKLKGKWERLNAVTYAGNKRKRKILGRDFKNAAAGTWLEAQLAIQPLVSDIEDLATYLQFRRFQVGVEYLPIRSKAETVTRSVNPDKYVYAVTSGAGTYITVVFKTVSKVKYKGQLKVDPLNGWVDWRDFSRLGFSLRQFAPTLWEITPWSFVLDYFVDVGALIESFNVPREDIAWFNKTRRSESTVEAVQGKTYNRPYANQYRIDVMNCQIWPAKGSCTRFDRVGGTTIQLPRPSITFDLPNGKQFVNLLALALSDSRQRFSFSL
jgi:hypothetical protein